MSKRTKQRKIKNQVDIQLNSISLHNIGNNLEVDTFDDDSEISFDSPTSSLNIVNNFDNIEIDSSSDSEIEDPFETNSNNNISDQLRNWSLNHNITNVALNNLVKIL